MLVQEHGPLSELESAEVVGAVLDVIAECHSHGICYGDVKPANFLLKWPYAEGDCK
jgi:serine/threonine protein kinase